MGRHSVTAREIVAAKVSNEGLDVPPELLRKFALKRLDTARDDVVRIGDVVFTVSRDPMHPQVHVYSLGAGTGFLAAVKRFHKMLWTRINHRFVLAIIRPDSTICKVAERFGWRRVGVNRIGYSIYRLDRG